MSTDLTPAERATVYRFDVAEPAPESLRERVALALFDSDYGGTDFYWEDLIDGPDAGRNYYRRHAAAAIAVITGGAA